MKYYIKSVSEALTYLRAFCVSCFSSLKKAILNWCLTNSSWEKTKSECFGFVCAQLCVVFFFFFSASCESRAHAAKST